MEEKLKEIIEKYEKLIDDRNIELKRLKDDRYNSLLDKYIGAMDNLNIFMDKYNNLLDRYDDLSQKYYKSEE